jgi:hypothetical protein
MSIMMLCLGLCPHCQRGLTTYATLADWDWGQAVSAPLVEARSVCSDGNSVSFDAAAALKVQPGTGRIGSSRYGMLQHMQHR